jgi:hypothetical protein
MEFNLRSGYLGVLDSGVVLMAVFVYLSALRVEGPTTAPCLACASVQKPYQQPRGATLRHVKLYMLRINQHCYLRSLNIDSVKLDLPGLHRQSSWHFD